MKISIKTRYFQVESTEDEEFKRNDCAHGDIQESHPEPANISAAETEMVEPVNIDFAHNTLSGAFLIF